MKKILIILLLIQASFSIYAQSELSTISDGQIIKDLTNFYTLYITESSKNQPNERQLNLIKHKYCSDKLLRKLSLEELDYDPFLNAQDCDIEWLKTLTITKDNKSKNKYIVGFIDNFSNKKNTIKLIISIISNKPKIIAIIE